MDDRCRRTEPHVFFCSSPIPGIAHRPQRIGLCDGHPTSPTVVVMPLDQFEEQPQRCWDKMWAAMRARWVEKGLIEAVEVAASQGSPTEGMDLQHRSDYSLRRGGAGRGGLQGQL